jgi:hypothetical protein
VITVRQALEERAKQSGGTLVYAKGTEIEGTSHAGFRAAVEAAKARMWLIVALG